MLAGFKCYVVPILIDCSSVTQAKEITTKFVRILKIENALFEAIFK